MQIIESIAEGRGLYSVREAALFSRVSTQTMNRWLFGTKQRKSLRTPLLDTTDGKYVTFIEFVEALAVGELRRMGISFPKIREAIETAQDAYHIDHPFAHRDHKTFAIGKDLYIQIDSVDPIGLTGKDKFQRSSKPILEIYMKGLTFGPDNLANSFTAFAHKESLITMNPNRLFGEPLVVRCGYSAQTLWSAAAEEGSMEVAAKNYGVDEEDVETACLYWNSLKAAA